MKRNDTQAVLRGSLTAIILKLVSEGGRMYGYEITKAVREQTGGKMALTEAALYPALHRLLEAGLLETESEEVDGRMRKYYRIAKNGKKEASRLVEEFGATLQTLQNLLHGIAPQG